MKKTWFILQGFLGLLALTACSSSKQAETMSERDALVMEKIDKVNYDDLLDLYGGPDAKLASSSRPQRVRRPASVDQQAAEAAASETRQNMTASSASSSSSSGPLATGNGAGKGRFKVTSRSCSALREPASDAPVIATVSAGKKIWTEPDATGWSKVFLRKTSAFLSSDCF